MQKREIPNSRDYIILVLLIIIAISIFLVEVILATSPQTQREVALYNAIEFILSISIGWQFQKIDSQKQFEQNLKRFAISAYRRISDIDKAIGRIQNEIGRMRLHYPSEKTHELDIINLLSIDIGDTVSSSIADWADIIGDEIKLKIQIKEKENEVKETMILFDEKAFINAVNEKEHNTRSNELKKLENEVSLLRANLPLALQDNATTVSVNDLIEDFRNKFFTRGFILIYANISKINNKIAIKEGSIVEISIKRTKVDPRMMVFFENEYIGILENPISRRNMGISDELYFSALQQFFSIFDLVDRKTLMIKGEIANIDLEIHRMKIVISNGTKAKAVKNIS